MKVKSPVRLSGCLLVAGLSSLLVMDAHAQRQMEKLGRGVVALHSATSQAYVGWRLLATDPTDAGFNLYRSTSGGAGVKLNSQVITNTTDFLDTTANFTVSNAWYVVPVIGGVEQAPGAPASPVEYHCPPAREMCQPLLHGASLAANSPVRQYLPLPLHAVTGGGAPPYDVKFCWVGDFDGDGEYDYLVDRLSTTTATNQFLQAYKRDGTLLWQMDMGYNSVNQYNIEPGAPRGVNTGTTPGLATTSTPRGASAISIGDKDNITVYDLDGDGKAEVIECLRQWPRDGRARTASVTDAIKDSNQSRLRTQHRLTSARRTSSPSDRVIQRRDYHDKQPRQLRLYRHQQRGRLELPSSARTADHQPGRHAAQFPAVRTAITHAPRFAQVLEFADRRHELPQVFQRRLHSEARC